MSRRERRARFPACPSTHPRSWPPGILLFAAAGCGSSDAPATAPPATSTPSASTAEQTGGAEASSSDDTRLPGVEKAELTATGSGTYDLAVTVSSPYDSPERYADGWRVLKAGTEEELGTHTLGHDHASEQPFTRDQSGLEIPDSVASITIEGRDQKNGYGGDTVTIDVPR